MGKKINSRSIFDTICDILLTIMSDNEEDKPCVNLVASYDSQCFSPLSKSILMTIMKSPEDQQSEEEGHNNSVPTDDESTTTSPEDEMPMPYVPIPSRDFVLSRRRFTPTFHGDVMLNGNPHYFLKWSQIEDTLYCVDNRLATEAYSAPLLKYKLDQHANRGDISSSVLSQEEEGYFQVRYEDHSFVLPKRIVH